MGGGRSVLRGEQPCSALLAPCERAEGRAEGASRPRCRPSSWAPPRAPARRAPARPAPAGAAGTRPARTRASVRPVRPPFALLPRRRRPLRGCVSVAAGATARLAPGRHRAAPGRCAWGRRVSATSRRRERGRGPGRAVPSPYLGPPPAPAPARARRRGRRWVPVLP